MATAVSSSILSVPSFAQFAEEVVREYEATGAKPVVLVDLDGTAVRPKDALLRADACAIARGGRILSSREEQQALNNALEVAPYELVEPNMPGVIQGFRERGIEVEGLTARWSIVEASTRAQLESLGIPMRVHFSNGQLKEGNMEEIVKLHPDCEAIAFADDNWTQLLSVANKTRRLGKSFLGYHSKANDPDFDFSGLDFPMMEAQLKHYRESRVWVSDKEWAPLYKAQDTPQVD